MLDVSIICDNFGRFAQKMTRGEVIKMKKNLIFMMVVVLGLFQVLPVKAETSEETVSKKFKSSQTTVGDAIGDYVLLDIEKCSLEKTIVADEGYTCYVPTQNGDAFWKLEVKTPSGKKDMTSGLLVSDVLDGKYTFSQAKQICADKSSLDARGNLRTVRWKLPTGYEKHLNGTYNCPNKDSDVVTLRANGILRVIGPKIRDELSDRGLNMTRVFWSSSVFPDGFVSANSFVGGADYYRGDYLQADLSVICVGR